MPYQVELRAAEKDVEVHVVEPVVESGPELSLYVFATGGVQDRADADRILAWIKARNEAGPHRPGFVLHMGAREMPLPVHGKDRQLLEQFFADLPQTCGGFGSWWSETCRHIDTLLRRYPASPATLHYFTGHAQDAPLEWDAQSLLDALDRQQSMLANPGGTSVRLICSLTDDAPFLSDARVRVSRLRGFLEDRAREHPEVDVSAIKRIIVTLEVEGDDKRLDLTDLEKPWRPFGSSGSELKLQWRRKQPSDKVNAGRIAVLRDIDIGDIGSSLKQY